MVERPWPRGLALSFVDDSAAKLGGAAALGMRTHHFTGYDGLRAALSDAGVPYGLP